MGLFSRKNKNINPFAEEQYISGGNLFEQKKERDVQEVLDLMNIATRYDASLANTITNKIAEQTLDSYWLLQYQVNYFINTINYEVEDVFLARKLKLLLRVAFLNGSAALIRTGEDIAVCGINKIERENLSNKLAEINVTPLTFENGNFRSKYEYDKLASITIKKKERLENDVVIFRWGSGAVSAWINIWPFIQSQKDILTMINVDKYSYIKKIEHRVNNPQTSKKELEEWFDPLKPYVTVLKGVDLNNRIEFNETATKINPNLLIEYYKQFCGIYYSLWGRRVNNDFKKERSLTQEISMTSDNYSILEKDWIDEFKYFATEVREKWGINIEVIDKEETIQDQQGEVDENVDQGE